MLFYIYYKMFREIRRDWSKRVHYISIKHAPYVTRVHRWRNVKWFYGQSERGYYLNYFIMRYNARSLRQRYERAQFTIHFTNEVKKLVPRALLSYISTWEFLRTLEKCEKHEPSARACPLFSSVHKKFPRAYIT